MHIPDGILTLPTALTCGAVSATGLAWAARRASAERRERLVPLAGMTGAFVFAAQMVQIPVLGGTSGHLLGGALTAILLGVGPAILVMASVLTVQCLLFQDGGLVALGANILNMGIIGPLVGAGIYKLAARRSLQSRALAAGLAGWISTLLAGTAAGMELGLSPSLPFSGAVAAMAGVHAVIGLLEGVVTGTVVALASQRLAGMLPGPAGRTAGQSSPGTAGMRRLAAATGALCLLLALVVAQLSSSLPDGLETVLSRFGVHPGKSPLPEVMPDYTIRSLRGAVGQALAGLLGLAGTLLVAWALTSLATRLRTHRRGDEKNTETDQEGDATS